MALVEELAQRGGIEEHLVTPITSARQNLGKVSNNLSRLADGEEGAVFDDISALGARMEGEALVTQGGSGTLSIPGRPAIAVTVLEADPSGTRLRFTEALVADDPLLRMA